MPKTNANPTFDPAAMFAPFAMPSVDVDALAAAQRRNVEALTAANKVAAEGARAYAARQTEIVRGALDDYSNAMRELMGVKDPQAGVAKQAEIAKATFEKSVAGARELAEIATKMQTETFEVLNKRVVESFDELPTFAAKS